MNCSKSNDQRRFRRFNAKEGAFAVLRNGDSKIGQLVDISRGGLGLRYISEEDGTDGFYELDIFLTNEGFYIKRVPFKTVSDFEITIQQPNQMVLMRRRGVKFGELSLKHISHLEFFIHNYTTPNA